jgi:hypothetical protein
MDAQDYPIAHFARMQELATALKGLPAQVLHHQYDYEIFGSWFLTMRHNGRVFRLMFDGKDQMFYLEASGDRESPYHWSHVIWEHADADNTPFPTADFLAALTSDSGLS